MSANAPPRYKVLVVGMGKRGLHHASAFHANPRFEVAGICDIDTTRLDAAAPKLGNPERGTDAAKLAATVKPCFASAPSPTSARA
jgi:predicted dehydrogenase